MPGSARGETEFLSELVARNGCGLLLDVNNVHVSCHDNGGDPAAYIDTLPPSAVGKSHLAGHFRDEDADGEVLLIDTHGAPVCDAVWMLYEQVIRSDAMDPARRTRRPHSHRLRPPPGGASHYLRGHAGGHAHRKFPGDLRPGGRFFRSMARDCVFADIGYAPREYPPAAETALHTQSLPSCAFPRTVASPAENGIGSWHTACSASAAPNSGCCANY